MHLNTDTEGASIELGESPIKADAKRKKGVTGGAGLSNLSKLGKRGRETGMQVALHRFFLKSAIYVPDFYYDHKG